MGSLVSAQPTGLRVLVVRIGAMGDVLHAMPAVAGLRAAMPDCRIGWAIEPGWMPLLQGENGRMPLVDRVHAVATKEWKRRAFSVRTAREIAALRLEMRAERYDVCIDLQGSVKSAVVGWMSGAKRRIGPAEPRERMARWLYDDAVKLSERNVIQQACELVGMAVGLKVAAASVELPVFDGGGIGTPDVLGVGGRFVVLVPTAGWGAKEWGVARYGRLAKMLIEAGYGVLVNAAGADSAKAEEIARTSGATVVRSTIAQMIALVRRAALVVGGDTGPVHLAAALGRPVVALFGPTDPGRNGPAFPGSTVTVFRDGSSVTDHRRHRDTEAGLGRIRVEEVLAAALAMLEVE